MTERLIELIRQEIKLLDSKTGLHAADVRIRLTKSIDDVGEYSFNEITEKFSFSLLYFLDTSIPKRALVHVIRHEYAHYFAHHVFNEKNHGYFFKHCCKQLDCEDLKEIRQIFLNAKEKSLQTQACSNNKILGNLIPRLS